MCGIVTIMAYSPDARPVDRQELLRMRDRMVARGPDGCGVWYSGDGRVALGHRRLAIIDVTASGAQPMANRDGTLIVTFNGEIYNYRELRASLRKKGYRFRSQSDTEVLLHLYAELGREMVRELRGMYAFAIWDEREKGLFVARDQFGIKPLYYADDGRTFRLASQVKALLAGGGVSTTPEPAGHVGFFLWGHVPEPHTLYREIRSVPAGSWLWVQQGEGGRRHAVRGPVTFCTLSEELAFAERQTPCANPAEARARLREAVVDSVRHHLLADVPVGVFLSAGLDSTTLAALAAEEGERRLQTVTLGFREFAGTADDEVPLAEAVARQLGARHRTVLIGKGDFQGELQRLLDGMDQPTTDGVNSYFVSRAAADLGLKVALSGLGGDELFGGYPSFSQIPRSVAALGTVAALPGVGRAFRLVCAGFLQRLTSPKYAGLLEYGGSYGGAYLLRRGLFMPWELPGLLDGELVREGWGELQTLLRLDGAVQGIESPHLKVSALESSWYMRNQLLRDADWASMAHSLEIRLPLVDRDLLRAVAPLYSRRPADKRDLASIPKRPLSREIRDRGKTGFCVPLRDWLVPEGSVGEERGLRGWSKRVYAEATGLPLPWARAPQSRVVRGTGPFPARLETAKGERILVLLTDGFGGHGGIAKFNRDLLTALCDRPNYRKVVAVPRLMAAPSEPRPARLSYLMGGIGGKVRFFRTVQRLLRQDGEFDLVVCAHINLLPVAEYARVVTGARLALVVHGIDAWQPVKSRLGNRLVRKVDAFVAVSEFTKTRFLSWSEVDAARGFVLPNCIEQRRFGPGAKSDELLRRYRLQGKKVVMTLGRLVSHERYKGFDELLELLPELAREIPEIAYLIVGSGDDAKRLEAKAAALGITDRVVFSGQVSEAEKADHYRLADVYAMPSRGEGFGIVFLEAMACGIPVVASRADGSREAVRGGELGRLVDPGDREELKEAVMAALRQPPGEVPAGLEYFSFDNFSARLYEIIDGIGRGDASNPRRAFP